MIRDIIITEDTELRLSKSKDGDHWTHNEEGEKCWTINRGLLGTIETCSMVIEIPPLQGPPSYPDFLKRRIFDGGSIFASAEHLPHYMEY